jgi:hypothetical protein
MNVISKRSAIRPLVLGIALLTFFPIASIFSESLPWQTDYAAAKTTATQQNKYILLDFTGSDWSLISRPSPLLPAKSLYWSNLIFLAGAGNPPLRNLRIKSWPRSIALRAFRLTCCLIRPAKKSAGKSGTWKVARRRS